MDIAGACGKTVRQKTDGEALSCCCRCSCCFLPVHEAQHPPYHQLKSWMGCVCPDNFFFLVNRCMADWNTFPEDFLCIIKYRAYNNLFTRWMVKILRMCSYSFFLAAKQNTEWYTRNVTTSFSLAGEGLSSVCVSWNFLLFTERYLSCVTTAFLSLPGGGLVGRHVAWQLLPCQQVKGWAVRMCNNSKDPK